MNETITYETVNSYDSETRFLSEVDHLSRLRKYDGSYDSRDLSEIHENLITAVKEAAVPFAVSTTHQEYRDGSFYWIDQTPIDVAMSGYKFHNHESAIKRVDVEVEEAIDVSLNLKPGKVKIFISPRMTLSDAPYDIAKQEHLADDDQIRIHSLNVDESGKVVGKYMQSMLIRDIPLSAWFGLLNDQNNIFSQSFNLVEDDSAITIMRTHSQLEIDEEKLPGGVLDIARATLPYMDEVSREKVENQLRLFEANQNDIHDIAETIAARWLDFEIELNESLLDGRATQTIINFIASLNGSWSEKTNDLIKNCQDNKGNLFMTRELAVELEKAKRNTLWVSAAVSAGNQEIINKVGYETASRIYENEAKISNLLGSDNLTGDQIIIISNLNNSLIASHNVNIGGGCAGSTNGSFSVVEMMELFKNRRENWKWTKGVCIMGNCSYRGEVVLVGPCSICKSCQNRFDALGF